MNPQATAASFSGMHQSPAVPRVIAVTSGKGGVGKTTISVNLAVALARANYRVMLLDADLGLANVDVLLGLTPRRTLNEVFEGQCALADILITGPAGIRVVPAASGIVKMAELGAHERNGLINGFGELEREIDFLVVDTAAGIGGTTLDFCNAAQEVIVVVCDDPASITDAYASIKVMAQHGGRNRFRVLVNQARDDSTGTALFARLLEVTDKFLNVSLDFAGQIPTDEQITRASRRRQCVLDAAPDCAAGRAFSRLAITIESWPRPTAASGKVEFFVERFAAADSDNKVAQT